MIAQEVRRAIVARRAKGQSYAEIAKELKLTESEPVLRGIARRELAKATQPKRAATKAAHMEERATEKADYRRVLCISDMHAPYQHPDTVAFLTAIKAKYKPTHVVCVGDEVDYHNLSFHDSDPDLPGAAEELQMAIEELKPLYKLFPRMDLIDSNHGSMLYRKGKHHGIPRKLLRDYGDVLDAPAGWKWHMDLLIRLPTGQDVYFHHGLASDVLKVVAQRGMCVVQGHYHTRFSVGYLGTPRDLLWGMQVGCSINSKELAFAYDRTNLGRPLIGHGIILDGQPRLLPMVLEVGGRWNGTVP